MNQYEYKKYGMNKKIQILSFSFKIFLNTILQRDT